MRHPKHDLNKLICRHVTGQIQYYSGTGTGFTLLFLRFAKLLYCSSSYKRAYPFFKFLPMKRFYILKVKHLEGQFVKFKAIPQPFCEILFHLPNLSFNGMHCDMCGNCRIFRHFLLLPLLLSEPPVEVRENKLVNKTSQINRTPWNLKLI